MIVKMVATLPIKVSVSIVVRQEKRIVSDSYFQQNRSTLVELNSNRIMVMVRLS